MIYDSWFPIPPDNWIKVADLRLPGRRISPAFDVFAFYATSKVSAATMRDSISHYISDHPSRARMNEMYRDKSDQQGA